jgi:integrase
MGAKQKRKERIHLTEASISRLKFSKGKNDETWFDDEIRGFGVRKRGDTDNYILQYQVHGETHVLRLGKCSEIKCDVARDLARAKRGEISKARLGLGIDPATARDNSKVDAKRPKPQTVGATIVEYLEAKQAKVRPRTYQGTKRYLEIFWRPLHGFSMDSIARVNVAAELRRITMRNGPTEANRARSSLSAFFRWAIGEGLCEQNPVTGTNKHEENDPRERTLSDEEAVTLWLTLTDNDYGRILKLLLLTGCRRDEIGALRWSEIDQDAKTITIPGSRTKNHTEHVVPLSERALDILKEIPRLENRDYVFGVSRNGGFSDWSKAKVRVDAKLKFETDWTVHDIRRTVRTGLGMLGIQPHIAEAVLNHLPAKLVRTYDRNTYAAEKKAALDLWANHLAVAIAQANGANVTALRKA